MSDSIFTTLKAMETEADLLVEQSRAKAEASRLEGEAEVERIREVLSQRVSGMRHTLEEELQGELARMRERAARDLGLAQEALQNQAQAAYPQAVAAVVKECLDHGHR